jgi:PAS domain S-box-containing protein
MNNENNPDKTNLRQKAEEALKNKAGIATVPNAESDILKLLQELEVSQIELEMQNEELRLEKSRTDIAVEKFIALYDEIYDFSPAGYFTLNNNGMITDINISGTKILGKDRSIILNSNFHHYVSSEHLALFDTFLENIIKTKTHQALELKLRIDTKTEIYVHLEGIFSEYKQKILITGVDITDRKIAENALIWSEEKFKSAFEFPFIGKVIFDVNGYATEVNNALCEMLGYSAEELSITGVNTISHPDDMIPDTLLYHEILEGKRDSYQLEKRYIHKDGHIVYTILAVKVIFDAAGEIKYGISQIIDITERKKAEKALEESDEIFDKFLENSPVYVFFKDENNRSLRLSRNYEKMIGKPLHELLHKNMYEIFPSELAKSMDEVDKEILKEGKKITVDEEFNGRQYHTIKFPIKIDGRPTILAGFTMDITDRKIAELELSRSEEKYRKLHQSLRDGYVYVSMDGTIRESNIAYQDMLGYSQAELEKLSYLDLTPKKWHSTETKIVAEDILPTGFSPVYEKEYIKKDGSVFPVELRTFLISDTNGQPEGMWAIVRNITGRKLVEEALKASEEKFKSIVESSPTAMYFYHLENDGRLVLIGANPAAEIITGVSPENLIGKTIEEAFPNLAATEIPELYKKVALGEIKHHSFEIDYSDDRFSGHYSVRVFKTGTNTIAVDFIDISDRKKVEEMLRQNETRLIELNATKDKFFSIIAHDLKNPFNSILGFSEMLKHEAEYLENTSIGNYANLINIASKHTFQLLENLLTWSRMQSDKVQFAPRSLVLNQVVIDEFLVAMHNAQSKNIALINKVNKNLIIEADENMLKNILRNLISNAIKFTPDNGRVEVDCSENESSYEISVTDNGVGIKPENIEKLFKIETNFSTRGTGNEKGTGLGLLLCKEFIAKHGGKIWVTSQPGTGSTFSISIPKGYL